MGKHLDICKTLRHCKKFGNFKKLGNCKKLESYFLLFCQSSFSSIFFKQDVSNENISTWIHTKTCKVLIENMMTNLLNCGRIELENLTCNHCWICNQVEDSLPSPSFIWKYHSAVIRSKHLSIRSLWKDNLSEEPTILEIGFKHLDWQSKYDTNLSDGHEANPSFQS